MAVPCRTFKRSPQLTDGIDVSAARFSTQEARSVEANERIQLPPADPRDAAPLPFDPVLVSAGITVAARSLWRGLFGWKRYRGDAPLPFDPVLVSAGINVAARSL